jgi:hypothetical protein
MNEELTIRKGKDCELKGKRKKYNELTGRKGKG